MISFFHPEFVVQVPSFVCLVSVEVIAVVVVNEADIGVMMVLVVFGGQGWDEGIKRSNQAHSSTPLNSADTKKNVNAIGFRR